MTQAEREARSKQFMGYVTSKLAAFAAAAREQFEAFGPGSLVLRFDGRGGNEPVVKEGDDAPVTIGYATREWAERGNDSNLVGLIETYDPKSEILVLAAYPDGTTDAGKFQLPAAAPGPHWEA